MSVTFSGMKTNPTTDRRNFVHAESENDGVGFNLANGNAVAFLKLLELPGEPYGDVPIADMVRAVQKAKASFDYRVDAVTRKDSESIGSGGCRIFSMGVDEDYFIRRLEQFSQLLADWIELGADTVSWD